MEATIEKRAGWSTRMLAACGFLLAAGLVAVMVSRQLAIAGAQDYLRSHYHADVEIPVRSIRPEFFDGPGSTGNPLPPLGFCWTVELQAGPSRAEVSLNPWTREVVDWHVEL